MAKNKVTSVRFTAEEERRIKELQSKIKNSQTGLECNASDIIRTAISHFYSHIMTNQNLRERPGDVTLSALRQKLIILNNLSDDCVPVVEIRPVDGFYFGATENWYCVISDLIKDIDNEIALAQKDDEEEIEDE